MLIVCLCFFLDFKKFKFLVFIGLGFIFYCSFEIKKFEFFILSLSNDSFVFDYFSDVSFLDNVPEKLLGVLIYYFKSSIVFSRF